MYPEAPVPTPGKVDGFLETNPRSRIKGTNLPKTVGHTYNDICEIL